MEWIRAQDPIEEHASVCIDRLTILIREEGYREEKMVSVSEVVEQEDSQFSDMGRVQLAEEIEVGDKEAARGRQGDPKLGHHSYRAVLGDKVASAPALKAALAHRRVRAVERITTVNDRAEWIWGLVQSYIPEWRVEVPDWPHAMQNLAKAGNAVWGEGTKEGRAWFVQRGTGLWRGERMRWKLPWINCLDVTRNVVKPFAKSRALSTITGTVSPKTDFGKRDALSAVAP